MRSKRIRGRLMLLGTAAIALAALAACDPDTSASAPAPSTKAVTASASTALQAPVNKAAAAPANPLEIPPSMASTTPDSADSTPATPATAQDTVRRYYAAINARNYAAAYAMWSNQGAASRQTYEGFAGGYATTTSVQARIGQAFDAEGAAGSRYIQVPIDLTSIRTDGSTRHYRGSFTLRAVMADGATPEQRQWHLDSADIEGYEPDAQPQAQEAKSP